MRAQRPVLRGIGLGLAALSLVGLGVLGCSLLHAGSVHARWERSEGVLLDAGVRESESWRPLGRREVRREDFVFFVHEWEGEEYEGDRLHAFRPPAVDLGGWRLRRIEALPRPPAPVPVLVDPEDPRHAVLEVGVDPWIAGSLVGLGVGLLAVGILLARAHSARGGGGRPGLRAAALLPLASLAVFVGRQWSLGVHPWAESLLVLIAAAVILRLLRPRPSSPRSWDASRDRLGLRAS